MIGKKLASRAILEVGKEDKSFWSEGQLSLFTK